MINNGGQFQDGHSWRQLYEAAVLELNQDLFPRRIAEAQKAIADRTLTLVRSNVDDQLEKEALANARLALQSLERTRRPDGHAA
jgi:hypothetical protein